MVKDDFLKQKLDLPISKSIDFILNLLEIDNFISQNDYFKYRYLEKIETCCDNAFLKSSESDLYEIHYVLHQLYDLQICDPLSKKSKNQSSPFLYELRNIIESHWLRYLENDFNSKGVNLNGDIKDTILKLCDNQKVSSHPLFDFLACEANNYQLFAFLNSDYELNIRFFDFLLLTLLNSPECLRQEMINNLWDESGKGDSKETHVRMFKDLISDYEIENKNDIPDNNSWSKLAGYNLFMLCSLNRKHYYVLLGIMAATEIIDPKSYLKVEKSFIRFAIDKKIFKYYSEHARVDVEHAKGWLNNVIIPILEERDVGRDILFGVYLRLKTCNEYYDSLYKYLKSL